MGTAEELGIEKTLQNVVFYQNDAQYTDFDLIVASNLIDRLSNPLLFLKTIHQRINMNGIFLLCDPYSWDIQHTPKMNWIGGKINETNHEPIYSEDEVRRVLLSINSQNNRINWKMIEEIDVPFVMKEQKRKFEYGISHCMILERV